MARAVPKRAAADKVRPSGYSAAMHRIIGRQRLDVDVG
jgi:hypothetical protein